MPYLDHFIVIDCLLLYSNVGKFLVLSNFFKGGGVMSVCLFDVIVDDNLVTYISICYYVHDIVIKWYF